MILRRTLAAALATLPALCRDRVVEDEGALAALRREQAALQERLASAVARDPLATRVLAEPGDLVLAIRTQVVADLVAEVAHRYFDKVELDLAEVRASADGEVRAKTFLGRIKVGEWQVEVRVERLRGRLAAGHPRLEFHPDRIDVEVPVKVRPAPGTIGLGFAWDSSGVASVVCDDFTVDRVLEGRVLEQQHRLAGAVRLSMGRRTLTATPVFEDRRVPLRVDLSPESWALVEEELLAQDTLSRCGILLKPAAVVEDLRGLAARGITVRLPEALFRSVRLPTHLEHRVSLGQRSVELSLASPVLRVGQDLLWTTANLATGEAGPGGE